MSHKKEIPGYQLAKNKQITVHLLEGTNHFTGYGSSYQLKGKCPWHPGASLVVPRIIVVFLEVALAKHKVDCPGVFWIWRCVEQDAFLLGFGLSSLQ